MAINGEDAKKKLVAKYPQYADSAKTAPKQGAYSDKFKSAKTVVVGGTPKKKTTAISKALGGK